jgi:branched-chain amino acid transport system permease protein
MNYARHVATAGGGAIRDGGAARTRGLAALAVMPAFIAALALVIVTGAGSFWLSIFTSSFACALALAGVGLLYAQLGMVSLCQYALAGLGGWVALRLNHPFHPPFEISLLAGAVLASAVGVLWGLPALWMRGLYLALVTLMLAGTFQVIVAVVDFPTGGPGFFGNEVNGVRIPMDRPSVAQGDRAYFIYVAAVLLLGLLLVELHRRSRAGRAWALIRKDEHMAAASGVNIVLYKAWAFALSGFLAGLTGGLLAGSVRGLSPDAFLASDSIMLFVLSVLGGATNWLGPIIGGVMLRVPAALLNDIGVNGFLAQVLFGALLIHALIKNPSGVSGGLFDLTRRLWQRAARRRAES